MRRFLWVLLAACTPRSELVIDRVDPGSGTSTQSTPVKIEGSGFLVPITSNLDTGDTTVEEMVVEVGGSRVGDAAWRTNQLIEGTVPAGLAIGSHDVTVRLGHYEGVLVDGFVVMGEGVPGDGGTGDGGTVPCLFGAWGTPQPITELNTSGFDAMPRLSPDELTIFFHSIRTSGTGDRDVWTANRASMTAPFGTPTNVTQLNTTAADRDPAPTGDGLIILFSSSRGGGYDLYVATRASTAQPFSAPQLVPGVNSASTEYFASLSADGLTLQFSSTRGGNADIWYATRPTTSDNFSAPQNRTEVNTPAGEFAPVLSDDGLELYLASTASGEADVWVSTRPDTASPFGAPTRVAVLSTPGNEDLPGWLSADGRRLYLSSGVVSTSARLYVATRPCL